MRQARAADATTVVTIFVNPRQFNVAADYTQYPRNEARDLAICEAEGVDLVFAPDVDGGLSAGLRHGRLGRRGRPSARGRGAARPLRWRRDRRRDPVRPRRRRARLLRPEGRPAGDGHPPDGARPGDRRPRSSPARRSASRTASRSRRATSTCRPSSAPRRRSCAGRCWRRAIGWEAGERSAEALRDAMCDDPRPTSRSPSVEYVSVADGATLAELDRVDGPALLSLAVRFGTTRLIDNEPLGRPSSRLMPGMAAGARILLAYLVFFAATRRGVPVPAGLLPRHSASGSPRSGSCPRSRPAIQLALGPGLGRTRRPVPADAPDAAAGRGGRDCRCDVLFRAIDFRGVLVGRSILYGGIVRDRPEPRCADARDARDRSAAAVRRGPGVRVAGVRRSRPLAVGFLLDAEGARSLFWVYIPFLVATWS